MKKISVLFVLIVSVFLFSCKTTGRFSGTANLTILIVDENGSAINDFDLLLTDSGQYKKGITNKNGFCVFQNISSGAYELTGSKNNYRRLDKVKINFTDRSEVFCFTVESGNEIFLLVERQFELNNYKKGLELLDELECQKKSDVYAAVCFYKAYGFAETGNQKQLKKEIAKIKALKNNYMESILPAVEKLIENSTENQILKRRINEETEENLVIEE